MVHGRRGFRTGRDVDDRDRRWLRQPTEFGFANAPLIAADGIMMRKCHLNTCFVFSPPESAVAHEPQDPVLHASAHRPVPQHVIN